MGSKTDIYDQPWVVKSEQKILFEHFCAQSSEPYEYVSKIFYPEEHDMSWYARRAEFMHINDSNYKTNIGCAVNSIEVYLKSI